MKFLFGKRQIPLGRLLTYVSLVLLPVALVAMLTSAPQAAPDSGKIEVTMSSEETKDFERIPEEGYSSLEKQEPVEIVAEQSCNYANVHCAQGEMSLTAKVNSLLTATVAFNKQGAEQKTSLVNFLNKAIAATYTPPASGTYYVASAIDDIGISRTAYAQGFGYYGLQPFLTTWKVMRNFVYVAFSVVIIGVAISILMRQSFSGQNSVTVQQMLPNIIITLIAITFSYAIAGFLIDLMYWIMYAVGSFIQVSTSGDASGGSYGGLVSGGKLGVNYILSLNIFEVFVNIASSGFTNTFSGVSGMIEGLLGEGILGKMAGWFSGGLAALVMIIIVLTNVFRLFFILAKSYVYVVLYTIFAPFILTMQAFKPGTFKRWVLSVAANLSPFVLTFFMLVFLGICNAVFQDSSTKGWTPPFMFAATGTGASTMGAIVSIGMILAMNEIITEFKKMIGGEGGFFEKMGNVAMANAEKGGLTKAAATPFTVPAKYGATLSKASGTWLADLGKAHIGAYFAGRNAAKAAEKSGLSKEEQIGARDTRRSTYLREQSPKRYAKWLGAVASPFDSFYDAEDRAKHREYLSIASTNVQQLSPDSADPGVKKLHESSKNWNEKYKYYWDWVYAGRPPIQTYTSLTK